MLILEILRGYGTVSSSEDPVAQEAPLYKGGRFGAFSTEVPDSRLQTLNLSLLKIISLLSHMFSSLSLASSGSEDLVGSMCTD